MILSNPFGLHGLYKNKALTWFSGISFSLKHDFIICVVVQQNKLGKTEW